MAADRFERKLAAILAADVFQYSRLMGADEEGTLRRMNNVRRDVINPVITEHRGRIVKTTGDGFLAEFSSAVDALRCAIEFQDNMTRHNANISAEDSIAFRIGINVGDIVFQDDDIFGEGVNIAARLEALADPGGICISQRVYEDGVGKVSLQCEDIGEQALKNIARPVRAYRVRHDGVGIGTRPSLAIPQKPSIAVLPFDNLSGDAQQQYFSDGITEDIITELSRFKSLFVIARNSSFAFRSKQVGVREIGRQLGVNCVVSVEAYATPRVKVCTFKLPVL